MEVRAAAPEPSSSTRPTEAVQAAELATHRGRRGPPSSPPAEAPMGPPLGPPWSSAARLCPHHGRRGGAPCSVQHLLEVPLKVQVQAQRLRGGLGGRHVHEIGVHGCLHEARGGR